MFRPVAAGFLLCVAGSFLCDDQFDIFLAVALFSGPAAILALGIYHHFVGSRHSMDLAALRRAHIRFVRPTRPRQGSPKGTGRAPVYYGTQSRVTPWHFITPTRAGGKWIA